MRFKRLGDTNWTDDGAADNQMRNADLTLDSRLLAGPQVARVGLQRRCDHNPRRDDERCGSHAASRDRRVCRFLARQHAARSWVVGSHGVHVGRRERYEVAQDGGTHELGF